MSDISADHEEYIAKLRNMNAETEKFFAEQRKLIAKADESRRERVGVVRTSGAAILAAGAAIGGLLVKLLGG
jgi:hypothetical protein